MVSPHRYSSHALILLMMLFITGCFAAASVMSLAQETTAYPFHTRPTELLARLPKLAAATSPKAPHDAHRSLPADVVRLLDRTDRGEVLKNRELIDAFLIASGVFDRAGRNAYAGRLDEIAAAARAATISAKTAVERGDALLKFLHKGPMKGGYEAQQTRLSVLLDTGKFNCVSATALYQIVAKRLGLSVQALSIPSTVEGHAMSMFVEGNRRIDVETTNPDGFGFQSKIKESGAAVIGVQLDPASGHDVSDQGLASLVAQNLASGDNKHDHRAAIQAALIGLALDPAENAQANNFVAAVNNWAMHLGKTHKHEEALAVTQFGLDLLPADDTLTNNADVLWHQYAAFEAQANRAASAVAVVRRAIKAGQLKNTEDAEATPFISVAGKLADAGKWQEAIAVLELARPAVESESAKRIHKWLVQVYRQWAEAERKAGNPDAAIGALAALWKRAPGDRDAKNAVAYFAQESLAELEQSGGPIAAAGMLAKFRAEFTGLDYLDEAGKLCARRAVEKLLAAKKFKEAADAVDRYRPLLAGEEARHEIGGMVIDGWGREMMREKKWEQAVKLYGDGLKQYPTSELVKHNAVTAWDTWANQAIKKNDWPEAARIYEQALQAVGDNAHLKHNLAVCRSRKK
jgi:tetratricopeptide (TPR) repeat protein